MFAADIRMVRRAYASLLPMGSESREESNPAAERVKEGFSLMTLLSMKHLPGRISEGISESRLEDVADVYAAGTE
jgi:hypothetical protein